MKSFSPTKFIASLNSIQHGVSTCISQVKTSDWGIEEKVNKVKSFGSQKLNTTIYKSSVIIQNNISCIIVIISDVLKLFLNILKISNNKPINIPFISLLMDDQVTA